MDQHLTAIEILGFAIRSEEEAARFYGHIAKMIQNELVREKYRRLAREEMEHRETLVALYQKLTGIYETPSRIPGLPQTAEGGPVPETFADSIEALLRLGVERERKARAFYQEAASKATDLSGAKVLRYLADVEHGHELMLQRELEAFLRDSQWYTEKAWPEMVHLGP